MQTLSGRKRRLSIGGCHNITDYGVDNPPSAPAPAEERPRGRTEGGRALIQRLCEEEEEWGEMLTRMLAYQEREEEKERGLHVYT